LPNQEKFAWENTVIFHASQTYFSINVRTVTPHEKRKEQQKRTENRREEMTSDIIDSISVLL
jgi:hypothetical protein